MNFEWNLRNCLIVLISVLVIVGIVTHLYERKDDLKLINYSQFIEEVEKGAVAKVVVSGNTIEATTTDNRSVKTHLPENMGFTSELLSKKIDIEAKSDSSPFWQKLLVAWIPTLLIIWVMFRLMKGQGVVSRNYKIKKTLLEKTTFNDVAGCDEAKFEMKEVVGFLKNPGVFKKIGVRVPRGILLEGAPGTGKTLLAKAIAGEAGVPFYSVSGSDFVEMYVGVGAARVRNTFAQAKKSAPSIIFIDEIDAVGQHRGFKDNNSEREQTLNQMLVEMDGFDANPGVIVIAATNRGDRLDPALLRPGRFDRRIVVPLPDVRGREQILQTHMKSVSLGDDVKPCLIAKGTPGLAGADLANLVNEAAIMAANAGKDVVTMQDFEAAKDKILLGTARSSMIQSKEETQTTAFHEAGHVVVAKLIPYPDPVHKASIIPRAHSLGVTLQLPTEDRSILDANYLLSRIAVLFGGRVAEELFLGRKTNGAMNDFKQASDLARRMVAQWGMSELGPITFTDDVGGIQTDLSEATKQKIDAEVRSIIIQQYQVAREIIANNMEKVQLIAAALLENETIDAEIIDAAMLSN